MFASPPQSSSVGGPTRRPSQARIAAVAALFGLALVGAGLTDAPLAADAARAPHALVAFGQFVTTFGTSEYMFAFSGLIATIAIVALGRGHAGWHGASLRLIAERALYFFAAVAVSGIVAQIVKHLVGRARPVLLAADGPFSFHPLSLPNTLASFPSGHTTSAFAAAVALGTMLPRWRWWLLGCALLIGLSRILVGAHYPSDVVAGAALGSLTSLVVARDFARRGLAFTLQARRAAIKPLRRAPPGPERRAGGPTSRKAGSP